MVAACVRWIANGVLYMPVDALFHRLAVLYSTEENARLTLVLKGYASDCCFWNVVGRAAIAVKLIGRLIRHAEILSASVESLTEVTLLSASPSLRGNGAANESKLAF